MITHSEHIDKVFEIAESPKAAALSRLAASWSRSISKYGLHPGEYRDPERIDGTLLKHKQDELDYFIKTASPHLDTLFQLVGKPGLGVLLTDDNGVVLDRRCKNSDLDEFKCWGLWPGTIWNESTEGTNGVGTCLAENRQVIIHRNEHFLARNTGISCIDAPIYNAEGNLLGVLDVSSARADQNHKLNLMISALVSEAAFRIEIDLFRKAYSNSRIMILPNDTDNLKSLVAFNDDDLVVGATRSARKRYEIPIGTEIKPCLLSNLDNKSNGDAFIQAERKVILQTLARTNNNVSEAARLLSIGRATLYRRMKKLHITNKHQ